MSVSSVGIPFNHQRSRVAEKTDTLRLTWEGSWQ